MVVASVFAFTVLSTGIFASERSKETVFSGLEEAKSSIEPRGSVIAYKANRGGTDTIYKISFVVSNAVSGEPVDLTPIRIDEDDLRLEVVRQCTSMRGVCDRVHDGRVVWAPTGPPTR